MGGSLFVNFLWRCFIVFCLAGAGWLAFGAQSSHATSSGLAAPSSIWPGPGLPLALSENLFAAQPAANAVVSVVALLLFFLAIWLKRQLDGARAALRQREADLENQTRERNETRGLANLELQVEIAEHKQVDSQLLESERRLATLMSNLPGMAYRCRNDADWTMEFISEGCRELTGYNAADLVDNRVIAYGQLIHASDRDDVWKRVQTALDSKTPFDLVYRIVTARGEEKWVMERGRGIYSERGDLLALEGFISDITQQKYTEYSLLQAKAVSEQLFHISATELTSANEALRQQENAFETLVNNANEGISISAADGSIVFANTKFSEMVGYSISEVLRANIKQLAHPDEYPLLADRLRRRLAGEVVPTQYETAILHKDGRKIPVELVGTRIAWQGQTADLSIIRDITGRRQAAQIIAVRLRLMEYATTHTLEQLLQKTLDELGDLVDSPIGFYHFVEADQNTLSLQAWSTRTEKDFCTAKAMERHYSIDSAGVWVDAFWQKRPVIHNEYAALTHRKGLPEGHAVLVRELVVPIVRDDRVVALLGVGNKPVNYTEQDVHMVAYLADVSWEIATHKQVEKELLQYRDRLEQLVEERTAELSQANERLAQEVHERKLNLAKYRTLFDAFPLGITIADASGRIIESNQEAERILSVPKHEQEKRAIGGEEWRIIRPDGTPMPAEEYASVRAGKAQCRVENVEMGIVKNDGEVSWINVTAAPIPAEGLGVAVVYSDITERKRIEEKLHESEEKLRILLDSMESNIMMLDDDGVYQYINQAGLKSIPGLSTPQEIIGKRLHDLYPAKVADWQLAQVQQVFRTGQGIVGDYENKDGGQSNWWHVSLQPIRSAAGQVAYVMVNSLDITQRMKAESALKESEKRTATILRVSPIVIGVSTVAEGRYTDVNDAFERVLGYSPSEVIGRTSIELNLWVENDARARILHHIKTHGRVDNFEIRLRRKSGEIFPALLYVTPIDLYDTPCLLTMVMDITERKQVEEQLRETRDAFQTIIHSSPLAILTLDAQDHITMWNPAAETMFGWPEEQIIGKINPTIPENKHKEQDALRVAALSGMAFSNLDTLRMRKDGSQFQVSLSVAPLRGQTGDVIGRMHIIADISERKKFQEELRQQATTDELTKVSNRRHFMELANNEIKRAARLKRPPAIALLDIDHFKQINDTFGHAAGDKALITFSKIFQQHVREIDVFARFGGDEFVLLMPETNQDQAYEVIERVRQGLAAHPVDLNGKSVTLNMSVGIASIASPDESIDTLLHHADQALYCAKEAGRNRTVRFDIME